MSALLRLSSSTSKVACQVRAGSITAPLSSASSLLPRMICASPLNQAHTLLFPRYTQAKATQKKGATKVNGRLRSSQHICSSNSSSIPTCAVGPSLLTRVQRNPRCPPVQHHTITHAHSHAQASSSKASSANQFYGPDRNKWLGERTSETLLVISPDSLSLHD
jgi:hypothetical protein